ncbi:MAG: hypothetical protein OEM05_12645 [Myxococcales bacterium]|nr:hypothetical protein [Myxococcales bacterium]
MRLRSRGLGRKELVMDFREYEIVRVDDEIVIVGAIRDPVNWDFTIRICEDDISGTARLLLRRPMLAMLLRGLFKRRKRHHWSRDRAEHLDEGRRRHEVTRENAVARARDSVEALAARRGDRKAPAAAMPAPAPVRKLEASAADGS